MFNASKDFKQLHDSLLELLSLEALEHLSYSELTDLYQLLSTLQKNVKLVQCEKSDDEWAVVEEIFRQG